MASWQAQDAKARFSELLDAAVEKGPQVITRRNVETAVIVPIEQWRQLQSAAKPSLKALLLAPGARFVALPLKPRQAAPSADTGAGLMRYLLDTNVVSELR